MRLAPPSDELDARRALLRYLTSKTCHCGEQKRRGVSFCWACVDLLPASIICELYKKLGHGYEEAYERACRFLKSPNAKAAGR